MNFEPKTEKEVAEVGLLPMGNYDFEVAEAAEKISNKGNDMIELKVRVYDNEGQHRTVFDYLVSTDGAAYKLRHFSYAIGLGAQYERGQINAADLAGKTGKCKVVIKKDKTGQYADKNAVADYLVPSTDTPQVNDDPRPAPPPFDDEIPF